MNGRTKLTLLFVRSSSLLAYSTVHIPNPFTGTGDNARHDIDKSRPRTPSEIFESNTMVADRMARIFTSNGIPVVPSMGR